MVADVLNRKTAEASGFLFFSVGSCSSNLFCYNFLVSHVIECVALNARRHFDELSKAYAHPKVNRTEGQ